MSTLPRAAAPPAAGDRPPPRQTDKWAPWFLPAGRAARSGAGGRPKRQSDGAVGIVSAIVSGGHHAVAALQSRDDVGEVARRALA